MRSPTKSPRPSSPSASMVGVFQLQTKPSIDRRSRSILLRRHLRVQLPVPLPELRRATAPAIRDRLPWDHQQVLDEGRGLEAQPQLGDQQSQREPPFHNRVRVVVCHFLQGRPWSRLASRSLGRVVHRAPNRTPDGEEGRYARGDILIQPSFHRPSDREDKKRESEIRVAVGK